MNYASETWTITKTLEQCHAAAQRHMERTMIDVSWQEHRTYELVMSKTKLRDKCTSLKRENGLVPVTQLTFQTTDEHPK